MLVACGWLVVSLRRGLWAAWSSYRRLEETDASMGYVASMCGVTVGYAYMWLTVRVDACPCVCRYELVTSSRDQGWNHFGASGQQFGKTIATHGHVAIIGAPHRDGGDAWGALMYVPPMLYFRVFER